jgi:hypothetical protein
MFSPSGSYLSNAKSLAERSNSDLDTRSVPRPVLRATQLAQSQTITVGFMR